MPDLFVTFVNYEMVKSRGSGYLASISRSKGHEVMEVLCTQT